MGPNNCSEFGQECEVGHIPRPKTFLILQAKREQRIYRRGGGEGGGGGGGGGGTSYQDSDNSLVLLLHQVTDDLVVEVVNRLPLHQTQELRQTDRQTNKQTDRCTYLDALTEVFLLF